MYIDKRLARAHLRDELDSWIKAKKLFFSKIQDWIRDYRDGKIEKRYSSKDARIKALSQDIMWDIADATLYSCFVLNKRTTLQALISKVHSLVKMPKVKEDSSYDEELHWSLKTIGEIISYCSGLFYVINRQTDREHEVFIKIEASDSIIKMFEQAFFIPPETNTLPIWNKNNNKLELDNRSEYAILGDKFNRHSNYLNLSVLNMLQRTKYSITKELIPYIRRKFSDAPQVNIASLIKQENIAQEVINDYKDKEFSFIYQFDKRGRIYDKGYHIHVQGDENNKALLEFSRKEKLTERGQYWILVDLANHYGLDKLNLDDRYQWSKEHWKDIQRNPSKYINEAESPLLFFQCLTNLRKACKGEPIGHIVRLDSTCSGVQLMSTLMRDEFSMKLTNVIGSEREDYYTYIAKQLMENYNHLNLFEGMSLKEIRSMVKKPIMTFWYNSESIPKEVFGDLTDECDAFYEVLLKASKGAKALMDEVNYCYPRDKDVIQWTLPDKHVAYCPSIIIKETKVEIKEFSTQIKFLTKTNKASYDNWRSLLPNIVHSIDGWVCRYIAMNLCTRGIQLSPIHDSFGVHPNYCDELRKVYRRALALLYKEDYIENILREVSTKEVSLDRGKFNEETYNSILNNIDGHYIC